MHHFYLFDMEPLTRDVFWASYWAWALFEIWVFSRDRKKASGEKKDRGSLFVIIVLITAGLAIAFNAPQLWPRAIIPLPPVPMFWTAIAMIWLGMVLRLWAILTLGRHFRTSVRILDEHKLITHGPYRVLRHPSYTGGLITITGVGLAFGNGLSLAATFSGMFMAYLVRIAVEERALHDHFGADFEVHKKRTWAVIPLVW